MPAWSATPRPRRARTRPAPRSTSNSSHTDTAVTRTSNLKLVKKAAVTDVNGDFTDRPG